MDDTPLHLSQKQRPQSFAETSLVNNSYKIPTITSLIPITLNLCLLYLQKAIGAAVSVSIGRPSSARSDPRISKDGEVGVVIPALTADSAQVTLLKEKVGSMEAQMKAMQEKVDKAVAMEGEMKLRLDSLQMTLMMLVNKGM